MTHENNLTLRLLRVKTNFPLKQYMGAYECEFGLLTDEQRNHVRMVWNHKAQDEHIVLNFEKLLEKLKTQ